MSSSDIGTKRASAASSPAPSAAPPDLPYAAGTDVKRLEIVNFDELAEQAKSVMPPAGHDQVAQGSGAEWTIRENRAAFDRVQIEPQYFKGVDTVDMSVTLLGSQLKIPILIPPMGNE